MGGNVLHQLRILKKDCRIIVYRYLRAKIFIKSILRIPRLWLTTVKFKCDLIQTMAFEKYEQYTVYLMHK